MSWIIISGIAKSVFVPTNGLVNITLANAGFNSISFLDKPVNRVWTYVLLGAWPSLEWNSIIYLAAITVSSPNSTKQPRWTVPFAPYPPQAIPV